MTWNTKWLHNDIKLLDTLYLLRRIVKDCPLPMTFVSHRLIRHICPHFPSFSFCCFCSCYYRAYSLMNMSPLVWPTMFSSTLCLLGLSVCNSLGNPNVSHCSSVHYLQELNLYCLCVGITSPGHPGLIPGRGRQQYWRGEPRAHTPPPCLHLGARWMTLGGAKLCSILQYAVAHSPGCFAKLSTYQTVN